MRVRVKPSQITLVLLFLLAFMGCSVQESLPETIPATISPTATPTEILTTTPLPMEAEPSGRLVSRRIDSPLVIDGQIDDAWSKAEPLQISLNWGLAGTEHAFDVHLRSLYTAHDIYFVAQWPGELPPDEENTVFNKLTFHWQIPEQAAQRLDCSIVCHTAFANSKGHFVSANAETIPQGGSGVLPAAGGWNADIWTLEWSRPLSSENPFDLQFDDLDQAYTFMLKIFERVEGRADPISRRHLLIFQP